MRRRVIGIVLAVAAGLPGPATATHGTEPPAPRPATRPAFGVGPLERLRVPTRAGEVHVEVVRPVTTQRVPVILTMTPYALLGENPSSYPLIRNGYARAIAHVPGTGSSGGCFDYGGRREQEAAYDLVEWLGTRSWSNGKVAMTGGSYDGTTANMAAASPALPEGPPPHLATIVPEIAIGDWYGYSYEGGVRYLLSDPAQRQGLVINEQGFDTPLVFDFGYGLAPPADRNEPNLAGKAVERLCPGMPDKADHTVHGYAGPVKDDFWRERDYTAAAHRVKVPVLVRGGWRDWNVKRSESTRFFAAVPADDPHTAEVEGVAAKMLVMDQGAHEGSTMPGWPTLLHAWFDRWLYGFATGADAQRSLWSMTNDGVVHQDVSWPPPGTQLRVPLTGGSWVDTGRTTEADVLLRRGTPGDALWFETPPLEVDVRIAGIPSLEVELATTGTTAHLTPVLFDLGPAVSEHEAPCTYPGTPDACLISRGFLDLRFRDGLEAPSDVAPLEPYRAVVRFVDTDHVVKAGHRIGLALMSSNAWWAVPSPQRTVNLLPTGELVLPVAS